MKTKKTFISVFAIIALVAVLVVSCVACQIITAYYTKADNELVSIEGNTSSYACEVFFYQ